MIYGCKDKKKVLDAVLHQELSEYPRADSNRNRQNRNLKSYPLDYGGISVYPCKDKPLFGNPQK